MPSLETRLRPLLKAVGYFGADATRARTAHALFRACALQASHPNWAKRAGIDAVGLDAGAGRATTSVYDTSREFLARIRAFADAYILGTEPSSMKLQPEP